MRILVTGICGFVGSTLARELRNGIDGAEVFGVDNLWRPGSETNRAALRTAGIPVHHGDVRNASDFEPLPRADWVIDAAANASVLAGVDGATTPRQLIEHNLNGTVNILEYCRRHSAGFVLLSSSRVYSIPALNAIPLKEQGKTFVIDGATVAPGVGPEGISEAFPAGAPASLYGATKLASEQLAQEYAGAFGVPVWIDRCGVLAGAGQFGQPAQGIFTWWLNRWRARRPLKYLGFGGKGLQVRDCLHPRDLAALLVRQLAGAPTKGEPVVFNVAGGAANAMSLAQLSGWCEKRFGTHAVERDGADRPFDVPWVVLDSAAAKRRWGWNASTPIDTVLEEIAGHAEANPHWLEVSEG
jgi:CDP-paratose 2-epimerase